MDNTLMATVLGIIRWVDQNYPSSADIEDRIQKRANEKGLDRGQLRLATWSALSNDFRVVKTGDKFTLLY